MPDWQEWTNFVFKRIGVPQFGPVKYPDHMTATEIIEKFGKEKFDQYFSFAFVRNPWDWELSHYKYILKKTKHPDHLRITELGSFDDYVAWRCDGRFRLQKEFLIHNDKIVVDHIGRFETLADDFRIVCQKAGLRYRLPNLNRTKRSNYVDQYSTRSRDLIAETYREDIETFGYQFGSNPTDKPATESNQTRAA